MKKFAGGVKAAGSAAGGGMKAAGGMTAGSIKMVAQIPGGGNSQEAKAAKAANTTKANTASGMQANQFSAAQLIQMEMAGELVEKKKQVELLNAQAEESSLQILDLNEQLRLTEQLLSESQLRAESLRIALSKIDPSYKKSQLVPIDPGRPAAPFDRLGTSVLTQMFSRLRAEDVCRLGMVCSFLFNNTRDDAVWVTFYAKEMMDQATHLQSASRRERNRLLALPFKAQYWAARPKESIVAGMAAEQAAKKTEQTATKALEIIKEDDLINKVKEKKEMLDKSQQLADKAKDTVVTTQAFVEAKKLLDTSKGRSVDATDAALVGQTMLTQLMAKGRTIESSEKSDLKTQAEAILTDMQALAGESVFLSTGISKLKSISASGDDAEITKLKTQGLTLAKSVRTPEEAKQALEENPEFVHEVKLLAMNYVEEAVTSAKIPNIKGSKDWGTYEIRGIKIDKLHITEESLDVLITRVVTVRVTKVSADFKGFDFSYDKTTFPKMADTGAASAQLADLESVIEFEIIVDDAGKLAVDNVKATIQIGALDVQVKAGTHKWLYNKLLKIFNERIKNTVEREVRKKIDQSVVALKHKMSDVTTALTAKMAQAKQDAINDGALDVDDDEEFEEDLGDQADLEPDAQVDNVESVAAALSPSVPAPRKAKKTSKTAEHSMPTIEGYLDKRKKKGNFGGAKTSAKKAIRSVQAVKGVKRGGVWQKRWFKVEDAKLVYYKSHRDAERVGDIKLTSIKSVNIDNEDPTVFLLEGTDGRVFTLKSKVEELAREWVTNIERAMRIAEANVGATGQDNDEEDDQEIGASVVVQFFMEHDMETVHTAIRASCLQCFDSAEPGDVKATLASAEIALATLMGVLDELAATGNLGRQDVVDGYAFQFHEMILLKIQEMVDHGDGVNGWDRTAAVSFVAWAADYHGRIESRVDDLSLEPKLTDMPVFSIMSDRYVPQHSGYMDKKSPKTVAGKTRWQKRFFVLSNCSMYYYKSEQEYADEAPPAGMISLDAAKELKRLPGSTQISMVVRGRNLKLRVDKESDMFVWLDKIQRSRDVADIYMNAQGGKQKVASRRSEEFDDKLPAARYQEVRDLFARTVDPCASERDLLGTLSAADTCLEELTEIVDDLSGCQPPRNDIVEFYVTSYHERIHEGLCQFLGDREVLDTLEKKLVIRLVEWVYSYHDRLAKLGVDIVANKLTEHPAMEHLNFLVPYRAGYLRRRIARTKQKGVKAYRKQWYELKNCVVNFWKEEPQEGQAPLGHVRTDQLRSVHIDGLTFVMFTGDKEFNLLAASQEDLDGWVNAIDQSTMRGIIRAEAFESTATNSAAVEAYLSEHVKAWDAQPDSEREAAADAIFVTLLPPVGSDEDLNEDTLEQRLGDAFDCVETFCGILDDVARCYPRRDDAHEWLTNAFHQRVAIKLGDFVTPSAQAFSQGMIHTLMSWLYSYQVAVDRSSLGELKPQLYDIDAVDTLLMQYVEQMVHVMRTWSTNLLRLEKDSQQTQHNNEQGYFTVVPTDMFKMVTQQMTLAQSSGLPKVVLCVCQGLGPVLEYYQTTLSRQIRDSWKKWEVEYLCAQVNDGSTCMMLLDDVSEEVANMIGDEWAEKIDFDTCLSGFLAVSGTASECIALSFFRDMKEVVDLMFDEEWFVEKVVHELIDSTVNFWGALEDMIPDVRWIKRIKTETFHQLVYVYLETILCKKKGNNFHVLTPKSLEAILADLQIIEDEFVEETISETTDAGVLTRTKGHLKAKVVGRGLFTVKDLLALFQCEPSNLVTMLTALLQDCPDINLGIVDRIITVRGDIKSKEKNKLLKACKAAIETSLKGANTATEDEEGPGTYRALQTAAVREYVEVNSDKVTTLQKGESIEVLETRRLESGQLRLRYAQGWTSLKSTSGKPLLRKVNMVETVFSEILRNQKDLNTNPKV